MLMKSATVFIASATTAAGGATVIGGGTLVTVGVFVSGVVAVCGAAYWLGQRMMELKQIGLKLQDGADRFEKIEGRLSRIENHCQTVCALRSAANNQTQRVEI